MRTSLVSVAILSAFAISAVGASALAQGNNPRTASASGPPPGIRVIDIGQVLKRHLLYKQGEEAINEEIKAFDEMQRKEMGEVNDLVKRGGEFAAGSRERKDLEDQILKRKAELNVRAAKKKSELTERNAKLLYSTYTAIQSEVNNFCRVMNVSLVLQYNSEKMNLENPNSVARGLNNPVVAQQGVDITEIILDVLNRRIDPEWKRKEAEGKTGISSRPGHRDVRPRE